MVDSESIHVEHFAINKEGLWQLKEHNTSQEKIFIETLDLRLPLKEIYEDSQL